ncbi:ubiquinol oxidase subunit II [Bosea sp. BIWAKO-01]|uniref:ubiquinol oxidase subunit II n=1 Tax=Bosea sp. BIWAKO-01 TaxID=506668 RepID=UPI00086C2473|nr:ubiquinol oxidase subunit II [Bosea sp. BIWAKO-01]GAU82657.1 cytochrome O ubiquinol oxidase subunit II [Bosea sp. BIWAKO-01]
MRILRILTVLPVLAMLGGCQMVLLAPSGDVAVQQRNLLLTSTALMLLIIVPVMALIVFFAWRYRASANATYDPDWHHSLPLEVVIWAVPLLIIIVIGAITWMATHLLDPYRPLGRISAAKPAAATRMSENAPPQGPLVIQVVALDWKWLFLYPEQGIASLNEVVAPVDQPIEFRITSSTVMNSLFIPALAGQIYAMPGMQTKLNAVINHPGDFEGFSANYSGAGFSDMRFRFRGVDREGFEAWTRAAREKGGPLGREEYLVLERPSEREPTRQFRDVAPDLFQAILNMCVDRAKMCTRDMMAMDAKGGGGREGISTVMALEYDKSVRRGGQPMPPRPFVTAICTPADVYGTAGVTARVAN